MTGYSIPFRPDWTSRGGGTILFVRKDIPCKTFETDCDADFEKFWGEIIKKNGYFLVLSVQIKVISQIILTEFIRHWANLMQLMTVLFYLQISVWNLRRKVLPSF